VKTTAKDALWPISGVSFGSRSSSLVTQPEDLYVPLREPSGQGLETGDIFEQLQHRIGEFRTGEIVTRLVSNNLNELVQLIVLQSVHA